MLGIIAHYYGPIIDHVIKTVYFYNQELIIVVRESIQLAIGMCKMSM